MIHHIIHISDIHIRAGDTIKSRYDEYIYTFDNLFKSIASQQSIHQKTAIIVLTGDIFHHKNKLEPAGLKIATYMLNGLGRLAPVFIIRGNHDYRQDLPKEHDMISALMSYNIPNVTYLDRTGTYTHQNIKFGLVAIQDTLLYGSTSGIVGELPDFPNMPDKAREYEYHIALFHGTINGVKLQNGQDVNDSLNGYPIDWFQGYDAILLGDIHLQQIKRAKIHTGSTSGKAVLPFTTVCNSYTYTAEGAPYGYPGSLIQQDFGETIKGHGYLLWNLRDKEIEAYHIKNSYGFITLKYNGSIDELEVQHRQFIQYNTNFVRLDKVITANWFPDRLHIRVIGENIVAEDLRLITEKIQSYGKTVLTIVRKTDAPSKNIVSDAADNKAGNEEESPDGLDKINSVDTLIQYIQTALTKDNKTVADVWKTWLKTPESLCVTTENIPEKIVKKITDKSEKLLKMAGKYVEEFEKVKSMTHEKSVFHINKMEWNWILNFREGNVFDFDKNSKNISILNAKNGCGKSNFLEIVCISLFGEGFKSRKNKNYSSGIICDKKPDGVMASTTIIFTLNSVKYKLYRVMRNNNVARNIYFDKNILSTIDLLGAESIIHQKSAVDTWIDDNIGAIDTFLMSTMLSQNADSDFFSLNSIEQKELLDRVLSLQHIDSLKVLLKDAIRYYANVTEIIESYYDGILSRLTDSTVDQKCIDELNGLKERLIAEETEVFGFFHKWNTVPEYKLLNIVDLDTLDRDIGALEVRIAKYPGLGIDSVLEEIRYAEKRMEGLITAQMKYHAFSDLVSDSNMTGIDTSEKITELFRKIEEHPYYKLSGYSVYDATPLPKKGLKEIDWRPEFERIREFDTWQKIQLQKFGEEGQLVLTSDVKKLEEKLCTLGMIIEEYPNRCKEATKNLKECKKRLTALTKEKEALLDRRPNRPSKGEDWLKEIEKQIEDYGDLDELQELRGALDKSIKQIPIICRQILTNREQIADAEKYIEECANLPFNPNCDACNSQPWRAKYEAAILSLPQLKFSLKKHLKDLKRLEYEGVDYTLGTDNSDKYVADLEDCYKTVKKMIEEVELYRVEKVGRTDFTKWSAEYEKCKDECESLEGEKGKLEVESKNLDTQYNKAVAEKSVLQSKLELIQLRSDEYTQYLAELSVKQKEVTAARKVLEESWYMLVSMYRQGIIEYLAYLKREILELGNLISEKRDILNQVKERCGLEAEFGELQRVRDVYSFWLSWRDKSIAVKDMQLRIRELETVLGGATGSADSQKIYIVELLKTIKQNIIILTYISEAFIGYREWIYKEQIAPLILNKVNTILELICDDRPLYLEAEWLDKIDTLSWFVRDGSSRPVIEKASGFQRFIIGIAMRVAINQLGFCKIQYGEFFIDEGFTACDADNLEKVPGFLRGLLRFYQNIYLATHLEDLKSSADRHIFIERQNGLSKIQYGDPDVIRHTEEGLQQKKRGRPSKKGDSVGEIVVIKTE